MKRNQSIPLIILLAVSIGVAFSGGYWSGALNRSVSEYEYGQAENLWCLGTEIIEDDVNGQWNISVTLENLGHANSTVVLVLIDGKSPDPHMVPSAFGNNVTVSPLPLEIKGCFKYEDRPSNGTITVSIKYGTVGFSSGKSGSTGSCGTLKWSQSFSCREGANPKYAHQGTLSGSSMLTDAMTLSLWFIVHAAFFLNNSA